MPAPRRYRLMDLFAGCGGMTRGFVDSGRFVPIFAVEFDSDAAATYALNFGAEHVSPIPIEDVASFPKADVVIGGPPCQGFSPLNRNLVGFERRGLWRQYLRALTESDAKAFVMKNVPQLLKSAEYEEFGRQANLFFELRGLGPRVDSREQDGAPGGGAPAPERSRGDGRGGAAPRRGARARAPRRRRASRSLVPAGAAADQLDRVTECTTVYHDVLHCNTACHA